MCNIYQDVNEKHKYPDCLVRPGSVSSSLMICYAMIKLSWEYEAKNNSSSVKQGQQESIKTDMKLISSKRLQCKSHID